MTNFLRGSSLVLGSMVFIVFAHGQANVPNGPLPPERAQGGIRACVLKVKNAVKQILLAPVDVKLPSRRALLEEQQLRSREIFRAVRRLKRQVIDNDSSLKAQIVDAANVDQHHLKELKSLLLARQQIKLELLDYYDQARRMGGDFETFESEANIKHLKLDLKFIAQLSKKLESDEVADLSFRKVWTHLLEQFRSDRQAIDAEFKLNEKNLRYQAEARINRWIKRGGLNQYAIESGPALSDKSFARKKSNPLYQPIPMQEQYVGEDEVSRFFESHKRVLEREPGDLVKYIKSPEEREAFRVVFYEGRIFSSKGLPLQFTCKKCIFIMDVASNFYLAPFDEVALFHHSSFLAGTPVAAAGVIRFIQDATGKVSVSYLDHMSGHYLPKASALERVQKELLSSGVDLKDTSIQLIH